MQNREIPTLGGRQKKIYLVVNNMDNDIQNKLNNLLNYLESIKSYSSIRDIVDLTKTSAMLPGDDEAKSYGVEEITKELKANVSGKSFKYFDFQLYVESCFEKITENNGGLAVYEKNHEQLDIFVGKCFMKN